MQDFFLILIPGVCLGWLAMRIAQPSGMDRSGRPVNDDAGDWSSTNRDFRTRLSLYYINVILLSRWRKGPAVILLSSIQ